MSEQAGNHHLVEHILHIIQESPLEIDQFFEGNGEERDPSEETDQTISAVLEIIRFMDEMPGGFLIYRAEGREEIVYANQALLRMFQCDTMEQLREITGNSFRGLVHPEDVEEVERSIQEQIAASQYDLDYVEYRIIRRDGSIRWIEDYGHFVRGADAKNFFYVFLSDATEKREQQLAEKASLMDEKRRGEQTLQNLIQAYDKERALINQEYLRRLEVIEGLSINYESIFYADLNEDEVLPYRLSCRYEPIFGGCNQMRSLSWAMSRYVDSWVHPKDREGFVQATTPDYIRRRLAVSKTYYINYRVLNGEQIQYLQLRIVNVGRGEPPAQIVMGYRRMDEELLREMEQKQMLSRALNDATLAINAKNTFLSNMSHDMRTPLNAIFGYTTLASQNNGDLDMVRSCLAQIDRASRQLMELINQVLELSQAESDGSRVEEQPCDLSEVVQWVYDCLKPRIEEKGITFLADCSGVIHREVWGDEEKLKKILLYLVTNAVMYTGIGGKVSITVVEEGLMPNHYGVYRLTVEDDGIGISREFQEQIFEPFAREKNTTLSGVHGIGLGLTITKRLVDMMDGKIAVQSVEGEGSVFTVTLRLRTAYASKDGAKRRDVPAVQPGRRKILLVEDNTINLEVETEILKALGFSIEPAADGQEALDKISGANPGEYDLVLMDIQMPVMNGWQAAEAIRRLPDPRVARIPIIALSANMFESDVKKSEESGIDAHIPKPLNVSQLLEAMERITLERRPTYMTAN